MTTTHYGRDDLMAVAAFRYCLGRRTYIVGDCADWLLDQWPNIGANTRHVIERDLREAILRDDEARSRGDDFKPLGWDCDRAEWMRVVGMIEAQNAMKDKA